MTLPILLPVVISQRAVAASKWGRLCLPPASLLRSGSPPCAGARWDNHPGCESRQNSREARVARAAEGRKLD